MTSIFRRSFSSGNMMSRIGITVAFIGCSAHALGSDVSDISDISDLNHFDFRLTMGVAPGIATLETSESRFADGTAYTANNGTDSFEALAGFTLEPGVFYSFAQDKHWGFVAGGSLFYRTVSGEATYYGDTDVTLRLNTYGVNIAVGPYFQSNKWRFEFFPVLGVGQAKLNIGVSSPTFSFDNSSEKSLSIDYGCRVGVLYELPNYVAFGLHVGYQAFMTNEASMTLDNGDSEKDRVEGDGLIATLSFILVF
jgi:hypothetical protein